MLNFTVCLVMSSKTVCASGAEKVIYSITEEFSETLFENGKILSKFADAPEDSKGLFDYPELRC